MDNDGQRGNSKAETAEDALKILEFLNQKWQKPKNIAKAKPAPTIVQVNTINGYTGLPVEDTRSHSAEKQGTAQAPTIRPLTYPVVTARFVKDPQALIKELEKEF